MQKVYFDHSIERYMRHIERSGAGEEGIVKIKAPAAWQPSSTPASTLYNPASMDIT